MKKISLIISFVVLFAVGGMAQIGDFRIGLKVGPSFDWASPGSAQTTNDGMGIGLVSGLVVDYYFTENVAVSSGLNLNLLRMKYTFTDRRWIGEVLEETDLLVSRRLKATNLEIPIKIKMKFDVTDSFGAYVEAGGGLSINVKDFGKDSYSYYWISSEGESYEDCTNQYRPLQASMIFGLGAEYELNKNLSAFAQLTFDHSFSNALVSSLAKQTGSIIRNNFIGVEVGILY